MASLLNMSGGSLLNKGSLLPSGYTQLEYIESTGSQYINTEVIPYRGLKTKIDFQYTVIENERSIFGAWDRSKGGQQVLYMATLYLNKWYYGSYTNDNYIAVEWKDNVIDTARHTIYIDGEGSISQDDTLLQTTSKISTGIATLPIYIFGRNWSTKLTLSKMRCYNFRMIDNNTLIRNFIPCVSPTNIVGMYDIVEGKFYSSPNGVAFIAGPEV